MHEERKKDSLVGTLYETPYAESSFLGRLETGEAQSSDDEGLDGVLESAEHRLGLRDFLVFRKLVSLRGSCNTRKKQERPF